MSYTLVLEWMPGDLYMSAVTARCTAPTSSYSVVWLPPNKVYQITLYCGSTSLVSFLVGAFRGKAWSYMILMPDLFSFAYVPNWYSQLDMLAEMALPEPWRFKNPIYLTKNPDTPILERYIHAIFKKQLIDYKDERNPSSAADYFHIENEFCCFHTGLYTRRYKAIYACFDRNKKKDSLLEWFFRGFADELSPMLRHISPLPKKPSYYMTQYGVNYNPEWPIRVNVEHILGDAENLSRIPPEIREAQNLPLLLETAVELARRKAVVEPSIVVPQGYQGRVQYLLPICLTDMEQHDLTMTLTTMEGNYCGNTCFTLEMA